MWLTPAVMDDDDDDDDAPPISVLSTAIQDKSQINYIAVIVILCPTQPQTREPQASKTAKRDDRPNNHDRH